MKSNENQKNANDQYLYYDSPIGIIKVCGTNNYIKSLFFRDPDIKRIEKPPQLLLDCVRQLKEYFNEKRKEFDLPLQPEGTAFQKAVWNALLDVPFGVTASYFDVAIKLGNAKAVRAVGAANGKNPISIIITCHRIIGSDGKMIGYGGGLWRKKWLLKHEQSLLL